MVYCCVVFVCRRPIHQCFNLLYCTVVQFVSCWLLCFRGKYMNSFGSIRIRLVVVLLYCRQVTQVPACFLLWLSNVCEGRWVKQNITRSQVKLSVFTCCLFIIILVRVLKTWCWHWYCKHPFGGWVLQWRLGVRHGRMFATAERDAMNDEVGRRRRWG